MDTFDVALALASLDPDLGPLDYEALCQGTTKLVGSGGFQEFYRSPMRTLNLPEIEHAMEPPPACRGIGRKGIDSVLYSSVVRHSLDDTRTALEMFDFRYTSSCLSLFAIPDPSPWIIHEFEWLYQLDTNCWSSHSHVNFTLTSSESGGFDIHVGCSTIHVPKYSSVHHPITKMLLLAEDSNRLQWGRFACPKSVAPKGITSMVNRQPSSASPNVYEAGWVPSPQSPTQLPVLFQKSTNEFGATNVSCSPSFSVIAGEAETHQVQAAPDAQDSVNAVLDSRSTVLPTAGIPLHYSLNDQTDANSNKPRPNNTAATNRLYEAGRTPVAHKPTEENKENLSNPNPCVTDRGISDKTKRPADTWYVATAAAHHATGNRHLFTLLEVESSDDLCVHAADGTPMRVCGRGNVVTETIAIPDVWFVPGLDVNLVSVGQLAELDYSIGFARGLCIISNASGAVVGQAHAGEDGLYELDFLQVPLVGMP